MCRRHFFVEYLHLIGFPLFFIDERRINYCRVESDFIDIITVL